MYTPYTWTEQDNWRMCVNCRGLVFAGNPAKGPCPAGGQHAPAMDTDYALVQNDAAFPNNPPPGQSNWQWCKNCQGLSFAGFPDQGACPAAAGAKHDHSGSGDYVIVIDDPAVPGTSNWRWCSQCEGLVFPGPGDNAGRCPAGGPHSPALTSDYVLSPVVERPAAGLGSNSNYWFYSPGPTSNGCNYLTGVSVTIFVDVDISADIDNFGFQLNALSANSSATTVQQYIIFKEPTQFTGMVDNWGANAELYKKSVKLVPTTWSKAVAAGTQFTISLLNDSSGNIFAVDFAFTDITGSQKGNQTINVLEYQAPIVGFTLNFVQGVGGGITKLFEGRGTITCAASNQMSVLGSSPHCAAVTFKTLETANSMYSMLPPGPSSTFTQLFKTTNA